MIIMDAERIDHINLRIPKESVEEALNFYRDLLDFEPYKLEEYRSDERTSFFLRQGDVLLNIRSKEDFERPDRKNLDHFCILVNDDIDELKDRLEENDVEVLRQGNPLGTEGRAPAIYIRDPFGYVIELKKTT